MDVSRCHEEDVPRSTVYAKSLVNEFVPTRVGVF